MHLPRLLGMTILRARMEEKIAFKDLINNHNHIFHYEKNRLFRMIGEEGVFYGYWNHSEPYKSTKDFTNDCFKQRTQGEEEMRNSLY